MWFVCDFNLSCETTPAATPLPPPSSHWPASKQAGKQAGHRVSPRKPARCLSTVMGHLKSVSTLPNCLLTRCHRNCVKSSAGGRGVGEENFLQKPKTALPSLFSAVSKSSANIRHFCNTYKILYLQNGKKKLQGTSDWKTTHLFIP